MMVALARSDFDQVREEHLPALERFIGDFLRKSGGAAGEMTAYHFETGGKRLRALIPLYVYHVLGHDPKEALPLGAAVEMIHNATLVHDDLQDGDELRRNRPTVWKRYSSAQAINCGDAMFQYAFRILVQLHAESDRLLRLMDRAAQSTLNVIEGQAQEFIMKEESFPDVNRYIGVIRGKTSGLFALPVVGAMEALGMDAKLCAAAERAAMDLGMLFQIQDDLLDIYGMKGRDRVATDVAEGKISILVAHVNEVGTPLDRAELSAILKKPREATSSSDIQHALELFDRYDAKGKAVSYIRKIQSAVSEDRELQASPEIRNVLIELGEQFLEPVHGIL